MSSFSSGLIVFLVLFSVKNVHCRFQNRIMGGNVTDPSAFDYSIVYIKSRRDDGITGSCTGTMISERHLLTCLHCVVNADQTFREHFTFDTIFGKDAKYKIKEIHIVRK
uniref:Peptidase S1 domain-containing protein n=1 Tax=Panagrolaimus sp. PS1159 TaxID=55785 RepID=A0AC35GHH4_9BILA